MVLFYGITFLASLSETCVKNMNAISAGIFAVLAKKLFYYLSLLLTIISLTLTLA